MVVCTSCAIVDRLAAGGISISIKVSIRVLGRFQYCGTRLLGLDPDQCQAILDGDPGGVSDKPRSSSAANYPSVASSWTSYAAGW